MNLPQGEYVIYLRKSRADLEAELRGEGETLAKHKSVLMKFANHHKLNIVEIFEEVISGERLSDRTEMLRLLDWINERPTRGVLVMDQDRLSRGNMQEQGFILNSFRSNNVLIVSPHKVLDLNDESDEFQADITSLFARQELRMITRRLQRGRDISAESGKYIGTRPPYGYDIHHQDGVRTLKPNEQADIVRLMFQWYDEGISSTEIARKLTDELQIPSYNGKAWNFNVILQILKNPVYIGRIQFRKQSRKKVNLPDKKYDIRQRPKEKIIDVPGLHPAIIDEDLFFRVQEKKKNNILIRNKKAYPPINALAGIVKCGKCGFTLVLKRHPKNHEIFYLKCNNKHCDNRSVRYDLIEDKVLNFLRAWIKDLKVEIKTRKPRTSHALQLKERLVQEKRDQLKLYEEQRANQFDLLEQRIYTQEIFLERSRTLSERIEETTKQLEKLEGELEQERQRKQNQTELLPKLENVLKYYVSSKDVKRKNMFLKEVIAEIRYWKGNDQRGGEFKLEIDPRIIK